MNFFSALISVSFILSTSNVLAENFEGNVVNCRMFVSGHINIHTNGTSDCGGTVLSISESITTTKISDRILSMCMTSLVSNKNLRVDYMSCDRTTAVITSNSTFQLINSE